MTKKAYIQPMTEIMEFDTEGALLTGSPTSLFDETADGDQSLAPGMDEILN